MEAVTEILQAYGYDGPQDMALGDHVEVSPESDGMMPLVIEKIDEHRVSVAHYYTKRGDLMADPDIVFWITDSGSWVPVEYTQHPGVYQRDESGLPGVQVFSEEWSANLERQGYVAAAKGGDRNGNPPVREHETIQFTGGG